MLLPFLLSFIFWSCNQQPVGKSLLVASKGGLSDESEDTISAPDNGSLDIQPDNAELLMNIDDSDTIEITGPCKDLNRKNNRILVEVFAGEDESVTPYISNALSDYCQNTSSGLLITDKCFWVTKGVGLVEEAGLPTQKSYPQCHNGRFGFSIKLGKILVTAGGPNLKYTVRYKLRTLDELLADTNWARTSVQRGLNTPTINSASYTASPSMQCNVQTSPARFNSSILYTLTRSTTDAAGANFTWSSFVNQSTATTVPGLSVFNWDDKASANIILQGLTYNYTLTGTESQYSYAPLATPSSTSSTVSCATTQLKVTSSPATANTCYVRLADTVFANSLWDAGVGVGNVMYEWGHSTVANWVGPESSAQAGYTSVCTDEVTCTLGGLVSNTTYYFAVREVGSDGQKGKWSDIAQCRPL